MTVPVLMLQSFTCQRGPSCCATQQKSPGAHIAGSPGQIPDALKTEHRVIDIERNHLHTMVTIGGGCGNPGGIGPRLIDSFFQDLSFFVFPVIHDLIRINRFIELPHGGIDTVLAEHTFHAEGARFIRHNGDHVLANLFILDQGIEDPDEGHGGG